MAFFEDVDINTLEGQVEVLNRLHADEIRAAMQYINHRVAIYGATSLQDQGMLDEHYKEELDHADKLAHWIDWLGGYLRNGLEEMAIIGPAAQENAGDIWKADANMSRNEILEFDLKAEISAIKAYTEAINLFQPINPAIALTLSQILADEYEHRRDLRNLLS